MYSQDEINAAIVRVETAKQNHPRGWVFLDQLGLAPADSYVVYAFQTARLHVRRLEVVDDPALTYAAGWLNGLAVGHEIGKGTPPTREGWTVKGEPDEAASSLADAVKRLPREP